MPLTGSGGHLSMERRQFVKVAELGVAASCDCKARHRAGSPGDQVAPAPRAFRSRSTRSTARPRCSPRRVAEATDGKFQIQVFAAGEIVPAFRRVDAVSNGTVEMCHTGSYYFFGKDPTFALGSAIPFGLNARQRTPGCMHGGGIELMQRVLRQVQHLRPSRAATPAPRWAAGSARRSRRSPTSRA